jgi:hypothetical protein
MRRAPLRLLAAVAFCGNPNGMPATLACTVPCTGGQGCIPWDANGGICWPLEGCFSL